MCPGVSADLYSHLQGWGQKADKFQPRQKGHNIDVEGQKDTCWWSESVNLKFCIVIHYLFIQHTPILGFHMSYSWLMYQWVSFFTSWSTSQLTNTYANISATEYIVILSKVFFSGLYCPASVLLLLFNFILITPLHFTLRPHTLEC